MTTYNLPAGIGFRRAVWTPVEQAQINRSEWSGGRSVMILPGKPYWTVSAETRPIIGQANVLAWRGFLARLKGPVHSFRMIAVEAAQHGASNPTASAAAAGATSLTLSGLPVSVTTLLDGHRLTVPFADGSVQMVTLVADVAADGSGVGTASINWPLRRAVVAGATIESLWPYAIVALDAPVAEPVDAGQVYGFSFDATDVL